MAAVRITINNTVIASNTATGANNAPIAVSRGDSATMAHNVTLLDGNNNPVATISYQKGRDPEVFIDAATGIKIDSEAVVPAHEALHLAVNDVTLS